MKIDSNNIGNYGPAYIHNIKSKTPVANAEPKQAAQITNDEKNFFVNLYPENKQDIVDYHFYQRTGKMSGVSIGSIFDKKG